MGFLTMCSSRKYPYTPPFLPQRATKIQRGGGFQKEAIFEELGWPLEVFFRGIGVVFKTNSCLVEQAISYFTVNRCFKAKIIVFINDLLIVVG